MNLKGAESDHYQMFFVFLKKSSRSILSRNNHFQRLILERVFFKYYKIHPT